MSATRHKWIIGGVYLSLIAVVIFLYRSETLTLLPVQSWPDILISVALLYIGFLVNSYAWFEVLRNGDLKVSFFDALISNGIAIFAKYIPGKVWMIVGRAAVLSQRGGISLEKATIFSTKAQYEALLVGALLSTWVLLSLGTYVGDPVWLLTLGFTLLIVVLLRLILGNVPALSGRLEHLRLIVVDIISMRTAWSALLFVLGWLIWCGGFFFLLSGLVDDVPAFEVAFGFVLAATLGILAFFSPAGLGAREGVLVGFLLWFDYRIDFAMTVAIFARVWFVFGELLMFVTALITTLYCSNKNSRRV